MNKKQQKREMLLHFLAHTRIKQRPDLPISLWQRLGIYGNDIARNISAYANHQWFKMLLKPARRA